jgi:hypothetical protein
MSDQLIEDVIFGRRVETFLGSDVGQYMLRRIENERYEFTEKLIVANPNDANEIQKLQNSILVVNSIKGWLEDVLVQSMESEVRLNEQDEEEESQ